MDLLSDTSSPKPLPLSKPKKIKEEEKYDVKEIQNEAMGLSHEESDMESNDPFNDNIGDTGDGYNEENNAEEEDNACTPNTKGEARKDVLLFTSNGLFTDMLAFMDVDHIDTF